MQEALNQKIDAFVAANKEQILKDIRVKRSEIRGKCACRRFFELLTLVS